MRAILNEVIPCRLTTAIKLVQYQSRQGKQNNIINSRQVHRVLHYTVQHFNSTWGSISTGSDRHLKEGTRTKVLKLITWY